MTRRLFGQVEILPLEISEHWGRLNSLAGARDAASPVIIGRVRVGSQEVTVTDRQLVLDEPKRRN